MPSSPGCKASFWCGLNRNLKTWWMQISLHVFTPTIWCYQNKGLYSRKFFSLRTQTYFRLSLVSAENNVCGPEPGNDFCDVGILSQSQFSSSGPRTTVWRIRCEEHSSFILSWNLIGQRETSHYVTEIISWLGFADIILAETRVILGK